MACGCQGAANSLASKFVVRWSDSTVSKPYDSEEEARVALARSGKTGIVKRA